MIETNIEYGEN
jgi:hypothetical protein